MSFKKKVYYRVFPNEKLDFDLIKIDRQCNKVYVRHLLELAKKAFKKEASYWEFNTNGIFFNATQEKIYTEVTTDLLTNVLKGYNAVIIGFGQTGTGKTFTTSGLHFSEEEFGIAPRVAKGLLNLKHRQPSNIKMCIQMSYVEFNHPWAVDLLSDLPKLIEIYKCREARKVKISNEFDALKCLFLGDVYANNENCAFLGEGRKSFVKNNSQYLSNLCSTAITFHITSKNMNLTNPTKICSRLHIIDLAGNDICTKNEASLKNAKEIGLANVTKSQLEQFILRLSENIPENIRIQQRMNIMLYYLDGDFSCDNILRFIGHIRARSEDMLLTLSMLRFGHIIQGLKTKTKQIKFDMNEEVELECLKKKLESYDKEQHLNSVLLNTDLVSGLNQPRIAHLNNLIQNYLLNEIGEITVMNVADTQLVLKSMKEICTNYQNELKKLQTENQILTNQNQSETSLKHRSSKSSSQGSVSKISRKSSKIRSKESVKEKKTSGSIISEKRLVNEDPGVLIDIPFPKRKKSKSTSTSAMKMSGSKKKSSNTSVNKQESKSSIKSFYHDGLPIPDFVPEKQEIWKHYVSHGTYKDRVEEYKMNEKDVRNSFVVYIKEIKKLQSSKEGVNRCRINLIMAQTFRTFNANKDEYDEDDDVVISVAETQCKELLDDVQVDLIEQQEKVLRCQEDLKLFLENRQNIIKRIDEDFDQYSREQFKVPSLISHEMDEDLQNSTFEVNLENPEQYLEKTEEIVLIPEVSEKTQMIRKLRKLMNIEIEKRKRIVNDKTRKWKNY